MRFIKIRWIVYGCINIIIFLVLFSPSWFSSSDIHPFLRTKNKTAGSFHTKEYEVARRKLDGTIWEIYHYLADQIESNKNSPQFQEFSKPATDHLISLLAQSANYSSLENADEWHRTELKNISKDLMASINELQNPKSCRRARSTICEMNFNCDLSCVFHKLAYCLKMGYVAKRAMILSRHNQEWLVNRQNFGSVFKSVSNCTYDRAVQHEPFIIHLNSIRLDKRLTRVNEDTYNNLVVRMPKMVPKMLKNKLHTHHSNPPAFFHAHFTHYIVKNFESFYDITDTFATNFDLSTPLVGIYVPRKEEKFYIPNKHSLDEYFKLAELWFKIQERQKPLKPKLKRRVYLATDDSTVVEKAKNEYKDFEIYSNDKLTHDSESKKQYSNSAIYNTLVDIQMLSKTNFVVCSFNVSACSIIYDIINVERGGAHNQVYMLDLIGPKNNTDGCYNHDFLDSEIYSNARAKKNKKNKQPKQESTIDNIIGTFSKFVSKSNVEIKKSKKSKKSKKRPQQVYVRPVRCILPVYKLSEEL